MFEKPLIAVDQDWMLFALLLCLVVFGFWAERTRWGSKLSGAVIVILGGLVLSNISLIPSDAPVYGIVGSYFVPLAIPLLLFRADLRKIIRETGPMLIAFIGGAIGTVLGTVAAFYLIPLGPESWQLSGIFCATYIGGAVNYIGTAEAVQMTSKDLLAAGIAADNLVMTIYFLFLFIIPSIMWFRKRYIQRIESVDSSNGAPEMATPSTREGISLVDMAKSLAIAAVLCAVSFWISSLAGVDGLGILIVTALAVALATFFPGQMGNIKGADQLGTLLMMVFFAVLGAGANISIVIKKGPLLFAFAALILFVHLIFILITGKIFKLDIREVVVASNANLGGPTTAAAMAVAKRWEALVIPSILCGTLGYAVATFIGAGIGYWLK